MKTNLPAYWVVIKPDNCQNNKTFKKVLALMNSITNNKYCVWDGYGKDIYYGVDGNKDYNGAGVFNDLSKCLNQPALLTLEDFERLTNKSKN